MQELVKFAFYGESEQGHKGDTMYNGKKSDGLDRHYFGNDLNAVQKMVKGARDQSKDYKVLQYKYTMFGDRTTCDVGTLYASPSKKA